MKKADRHEGIDSLSCYSINKMLMFDETKEKIEKSDDLLALAKARKHGRFGDIINQKMLDLLENSDNQYDITYLINLKNYMYKRYYSDDPTRPIRRWPEDQKVQERIKALITERINEAAPLSLIIIAKDLLVMQQNDIKIGDSNLLPNILHRIKNVEPVNDPAITIELLDKMLHEQFSKEEIGEASSRYQLTIFE